MISTLSRRPFAHCAVVALLFAHVIIPCTALEAKVALSGDATEPVQIPAPAQADNAVAPPEDSTAGGVLAKLKYFPVLGAQGAGLLQLAEEGLGINISNLELSKIVPMLMELQKNVHDHYVLTKGKKGKYQPSSLLKRVVGRKSQSKVIKTIKKFAPNTDDGELIQQLDVVTQVLHELHTNPQNSMHDILKSVSNAVGLDLEDEDMKELGSHMQWAQDLVKKFLPFFPSSLTGQKAEEL